MISISFAVPPRMPEFDMGDMLEMARDIGDHTVNSIQQNFASGGRPRRWESIKRTGMPSHLFKSGSLMRSVDYRVIPESDAIVIHFQALGMPYANVHQRGGGNQYNPTCIPPRPYMVLQDEDIRWIRWRIRDEMITKLGRMA